MAVRVWHSVEQRLDGHNRGLGPVFVATLVATRSDVRAQEAQVR